MEHDLEQKIKESLLEDLIEKMSDRGGDRIKPKSVAVEVAAPDKSKLAEGLDKAKSVLGSLPTGQEGEDEHAEGQGGEDEDDEQRLMQLLADDDDDDEDGGTMASHGARRS